MRVEQAGGDGQTALEMFFEDFDARDHRVVAILESALDRERLGDTWHALILVAAKRTADLGISFEFTGDLVKNLSEWCRKTTAEFLKASA